MPITLDYRESQLYQKGWEERDELAQKDLEQIRKVREKLKKLRAEIRKRREKERILKEKEKIMKENGRVLKEKLGEEKEKENTQFDKRYSIRILLRKNTDLDFICEVLNVSKEDVMQIKAGLEGSVDPEK